jgi:hypothetical protein
MRKLKRMDLRDLAIFIKDEPWADTNKSPIEEQSEGDAVSVSCILGW